MDDQLRADLAWLLAQVERHSHAAEVLTRCAELRERYGVERDGPDTLRAVKAATEAKRNRNA